MRGGDDDPTVGPHEIMYRDLVRRPWWSGRKVPRYLPTADRVAYGPRGHRIRIYLLSRVEAVEALPEFSPRTGGTRPGPRVEGVPERWLARWRRVHRQLGGAWSPDLVPVMTARATALYWRYRYRGHSALLAAHQTCREYPDEAVPPTPLPEPPGRQNHRDAGPRR